jgi:hypothetical protein
METQMGENNITLFYIYLEYYIHKKHQLPRFSNNNLKEEPTPYLQAPTTP